MTADANDSRPTKGNGPISRWIDRLAGFDFFISYAHADLPGYADTLQQQLHARGFKAFLDKQVYVPGDELNAATRRRIEASSKLIVLVGPAALDSYWVRQEIETALRLQRPVIAIDLLGDLGDRESNTLGKLLRDRIHIREPDGIDAIQPSDATLDALARSFQATRRDSLRLRLAFAGAFFFALLAGVALWQKQLADARYLAHKALCDDVVARVAEGRRKIEDLRIGVFGELIAEVTTTLAQLPDPKTDLKCEPEA